jgi:VWFA-related protein
LKDGSRSEDVIFMNGPGGDERLDVNLVELYTVVTDPTGRPIQGLGAQDFLVYEEYAPQTLAEVKDASELPLSLGLLVDSSASMAGSMRQVAIAAVDFLFLTLREGTDRAFLVDFDTEPRLVQSLTSDLESVARPIVRLRADGYTALCDAIVYSLVQMRTVEGRRALVVLSDGVGREERVGYATCKRLAQQVGIPIYAIVLDREGDEKQRAQGIEDVVAAVGGRVFYVPNLDNLGDVYRTVRQELDSQYLLTYYPEPNGDDSFRHVQVEVRRPGLEVRSVAGYWP